MSSSLLVFLAHLGATLLMTGLMGFVQLDHYPLLALVGRDSFVEYERRHIRLAVLWILPLMLLETTTGLLLLRHPPPGVDAAQAWAGLGLLAVVWGSTFALQWPLHYRLKDGFDERTHAKLVRSNWIRTAAYAARAALVLWMTARALQA